MSTLEFVQALEANAQGRFVRWHPLLWRELLDGSAQRLAEALDATGSDAGEAEALWRTYLKLGAEAIGLGYLYPESAGRKNFFTLAWSNLVPRLLAQVSPTERPQVLAQLWNLGENLESAPPWVQRLFCRVGEELPSLENIESRLRERTATAMEEPEKQVGYSAHVHWVDLSREDGRFLPGPLHFLAPSVVCVHDRHRGAVAGREAATQGVWLTEQPMLLGAMGCSETPEVEKQGMGLLSDVERGDPRTGEWFSSAANTWRVAATLHTSQWLVVLVP
ncbi:hypothetical protein [Hyalangium rubrum]|uniref:Uncharacterized protein n=1 Tax=Hyalangium rubrum TaxID=3103134 RepID=A0ABU5HH29_9BACT|nr:hypothetical protein [Hyalangium sp. s54d21]MDY7232462.1 hypothetical protein [Hyalangium sp. s54d21]